MAKHYRMLIGGEWVDGAAGSQPIINPANGETIGEAPQASVEQAEAAAQAARDAFPGWWATPPAERARLLQAVADRLRERQADLVPLIISETGATAQVGSRMQVPIAIDSPAFPEQSRRPAWRAMTKRTGRVPLARNEAISRPASSAGGGANTRTSVLAEVAVMVLLPGGTIA